MGRGKGQHLGEGKSECVFVHVFACYVVCGTDRTSCSAIPPFMLLQGTELLERISKKKELGCKCVSFMTVEEQKADRKASVFWDLLGGKVKAKRKLEEVCGVCLSCHWPFSSRT